MSKIEWTEKTWNPIVGCSIASTGCRGCYAVSECWRKMAHPNKAVAKKFEGTVRKTQAGQLVWTGRINFDEKALLEPLRRKTPTTYFVNSLSDLFHESLTDEEIDRVYAIMALTPQHRYQVLSKRGDRMADYLTTCPSALRRRAWQKAAPEGLGEKHAELFTRWPLPNVAHGVSVENQEADWRVEHLRTVPSAIRFLSCEPLVGPLSIARFLPDLDWVIAGGESGPKARPMHPDWPRALRDECAQFEHVAFFFKQWGNWREVPLDPADWEPLPEKNLKRGKATILPNSSFMGRGFFPMEAKNAAQMDRMQKKVAGRVLDGETHDSMPTWKV